jgi:hypothetical protein
MAVRCKWCRIPLFWFGGRQAKGSRVAPFGNWGWFSSRVIFKIRPFFDAFQRPPSTGGDRSQFGQTDVDVESKKKALIVEQEYAIAIRRLAGGYCIVYWSNNCPSLWRSTARQKHVNCFSVSRHSVCATVRLGCKCIDIPFTLKTFVLFPPPHSPIGELRWADPQPAATWSGVHSFRFIIATRGSWCR